MNTLRIMQAASLLALAALAASGCRSWTPASSGSRDYLVGWYELPSRHYRTREIIPGPGTLIPVFERGGRYYSICRGAEVPLTVCPEGLEWGLAPSSMKGTKIGMDAVSKNPYIVIEDANAQYEGDCSTSGEKQFMQKIAKPFGLLDAKIVRPPRTHGDFVGCYQPAWFPVFRWIVTKDGDRYRLVGQEAEKGKWESRENESASLEPLRGQLGFSWGERKEVTLVFNRDLNRFECASPDGSFRMPLVRVAPSLPPGAGFPAPPRAMGIPSWH